MQEINSSSEDISRYEGPEQSGKFHCPALYIPSQFWWKFPIIVYDTA